MATGGLGWCTRSEAYLLDKKDQPKPVLASPVTSLVLNVRDQGAIGDGQTKDTSALQRALDRCAVLGGGEVQVPAGNYLTGTLRIRSKTRLHLQAGAVLLGSPDLSDYPLTQVRWEGRWHEGYASLITATEATNVTISGPGRVVASTEMKGRLEPTTQRRHPALLEFTSCAQLLVEGCDVQGNDMWCVHPTYCEQVVFRDLAVRGGADGMDVDSCRHVVIEGCTFATGDDCISLKSGRGAEGLAIGRPTEDVQIRGCTFSDAHWACIGIGSETSGGIRDVAIEHCKCLGAETYAIYIKSRPGRGAFLENIAVTDFEVSGAQQGFLRLNLLDSGKQDECPVAGLEGIPLVRNFRFKNIRVDAVPVLVDAKAIHPDRPLVGFSLEDVSGTCARGMQLANMQDVRLAAIHVTGYTGPLLSTYRVSGRGLEGAVPMDAPKLPDPVLNESPAACLAKA